MKVIPCGTIVTLKLNEEIKGMITALQVRFDRLQYEVAYEIAGEYKYLWVNEAEFELKDKNQFNEIGFK